MPASFLVPELDRQIGLVGALVFRETNVSVDSEERASEGFGI